jgi:type I restriction enzyme S subunit
MAYPSTWKKTIMKELYSGFWDGPHATPKESENGPVYLGIKNISEDGQLDFSDIRHISEEDYPTWIRRVEPKPGDIVFTYEATLHRYAIIPEGFRGCLGRRLALLRLNPSVVDTRFLFYYFFGQEWRKTVSKYMILGSTVDRIPIIEFPNFEVVLPPLPIQRKIADILSAYDDLIENNTRRIRILEQMAQAMYREWFVHFRFPGHEGVKVVDGLPEGWEAKSLGDIACEVRRGVQPNQVHPNTPYFGLEHLPRKSIALAEWGKAREVQSTKLAFKKGEILFGKIRPYFHKVGVAPVDGVCSSDTIVIVSKLPEFYGLVLACVSSEDFVNHATLTSQGTKMPRANWDILVKYPVAVPHQPLLQQFNDQMKDMVELIQNLIFRNRNLRRTRDLLLPRLVGGEIEILSD